MAQKKQVDEMDPHTDGIPMGAVWERDDPGTQETTHETHSAVPRDADEQPEENTSRPEGETEGTPTEGVIVPKGTPDDAVSPKKALLQDVNTKLGASLAAWHTYALLACHKRWQTIEAYVQDPDLYEEIVTEARAEIRREKAAVAKRLDKAKIRKDHAQIEVLSEELDELKKRAPSAMKMDALTLKARGGRLARQLAVPAAVLFGPVAAGIGVGAWWALLAYPVAWGWLAAQGHAMAVADGTVTVTEEPAERARELVGQASVPGDVPRDVVVGATEAENLILGHLSEWETRTEGRGLEGVVPGTPTVDALGIRVVLTTSGKLTLELLKKKLPVVRAALSVPRDVRTDLHPGEVGDQAVLRIRTRSPERDMAWNPRRDGIGVDADTGKPVTLPKGRKLIAGTSGSGKSVLLRVVMAEAMHSGEPTVVVYIDGKGEESALWRGKMRIAVEPEDIHQVLSELARESLDRRRIMQDKQIATWVPTKSRPRIVVVVDEGAEVMALDDPEDGLDIMAPLRSLGRTGRSRCIDLVWATQKPTIGAGIDSQINGVMDVRAVLRTAGATETRQVLASKWTAHELPEFGHAYVKGTGRGEEQAPVQVWDLSDDDQVTALPVRPVWAYAPDPQAPEVEQGQAPEGELPPVLAAALLLSEGADGVTGHDVAAACGLDLLDTQKALRAAGVKAGRFTNGSGTQVRGYERVALEEAASRYSV
ncbi:FtsK/SpoIIIE domain-containing protein [Nocardiopsis sp. NPDC058789]|uniref:FtsK/SpoIIIE domain-containing protein n=1 Tax=Nocardiopsis sp. NPDC058789 TaxID=3346634 RepID=UPI0036700DE3